MRFVPALVLLAHTAFVTSAAAQPARKSRLDVNGDPLPDGAVARLGTRRFQPPGRVGAIALSPDGTTVAATSPDSDGRARISLLDTSSGKLLGQHVVPDIDGKSVQFTPDGNGLVCRSWGAIEVVDTATSEVIHSLGVADLSEHAVALTADGNWVAAQLDRPVYHAPVGVWETKTGKEVASLPGRGSVCKGLAFGPDGKRLLLRSVVPSQAGDGGKSWGGPDCKVALTCIDVNLRKIVGETTVGGAQEVALCPDGETVAFAAADQRSVCVRHLPTGAERCVIPVSHSQFAFAPDRGLRP
jgi:WD40 repeat protein